MSALDLAPLRALKRRGWGAFYGDRMLSSALLIPVNGVVPDRGAVVTSLVGAPEWERYALSEERQVHFHGEVVNGVSR